MTAGPPGLGSNRQRALLVAATVTVGTVALALVAAGIDRGEIVATLLFLPVFAAGALAGRTAGYGAAAAATALYVLVRRGDLSEAEMASAVALTLTRAGAYAVTGRVGVLARGLVGEGEEASEAGAVRPSPRPHPVGGEEPPATRRGVDDPAPRVLVGVGAFGAAPRRQGGTGGDNGYGGDGYGGDHGDGAMMMSEAWPPEPGPEATGEHEGAWGEPGAEGRWFDGDDWQAAKASWRRPYGPPDEEEDPGSQADPGSGPGAAPAVDAWGPPGVVAPAGRAWDERPVSDPWGPPGAVPAADPWDGPEPEGPVAPADPWGPPTAVPTADPWGSPPAGSGPPGDPDGPGAWGGAAGTTRAWAAPVPPGVGEPVGGAGAGSWPVPAVDEAPPVWDEAPAGGAAWEEAPIAGPAWPAGPRPEPTPAPPLDLPAVDPETGLWTARFLRDRLTSERARSRRTGHPFSMVLVQVPDEPLAQLPYRRQVALLRELGYQLVAGGVVDHLVHVPDQAQHWFAVILPDTDRSAAQVLERRLRLGIGGYLSSRGLRLHELASASLSAPDDDPAMGRIWEALIGPDDGGPGGGPTR